MGDKTIYKLVKPLCPESFQAFEDYILNGYNLSKQEINLLRQAYSNLEEKYMGCEYLGMSKREIDEFDKVFLE